MMENLLKLTMIKYHYTYNIGKSVSLVKLVDLGSTYSLEKR